MQRVLAVRLLAVAAVLLGVIYLSGCGGGNNANTKVATVVITPTTLSLNEGAVGTLSAVAENSGGAGIAADITFTSSNPSIATVSSGGLVCAGVWDANIINCTPTLGSGGVGQVTITASSGGVSATATVYVHLQVDQVVAVPPSSCVTMGQSVTISGLAYNTTAPGCSPAAPCDITSSVGPFTFGSNDFTVAATSSGIQSTYNSNDNTPTYVSGGTITGSKGQTCDLSTFNTVIGATATVALTGTNTIASGTQLTITSPGFGATIAPTTATLSNGTATCSGTATVQTDITPGVLTAQGPGMTTVYASVSGVNGVGVGYETCRVVSIMVHDANSSNTSFTLNPQGTQGLLADVMDSAGQAISPTLTWGSSSPAAATVPTFGSGVRTATVTAVTGGTAYITASCSFPDCNIRVPAQYGLNVATVAVTQPSATTVYAAGTNSLSLVPISTSSNTAGTAITLPFAPNSIIADPNGVYVYLGSSSGLMRVTVSSGAVITYAVDGTVLAITPNGQYVLVSDSTGNNISYLNVTTATLAGTTANSASSSAYTPDSMFNEWVSTTKLGFGLPTGFISSVMLPYTANALDISAQGGLTFLTGASTMGNEVDVRLTCDQSEDQALSASNPTLLKALPNGSGAVAADSPNIDVVSTPATLSPGCMPMTTVPTLTPYDLGAGAFTAQQLLVSADSTRAWIVSDLPQLLSFNVPMLTPSSVALAGGTTAFNGGITADGSRVYVGTNDGTVHEIDTASMTDAAQIAVGLKDGNGNPVPPNLVTVIP